MNGQLRKAINIKGMFKHKYDIFKTKTIKKDIQKTIKIKTVRITTAVITTKPKHSGILLTLSCLKMVSTEKTLF